MPKDSRSHIETGRKGSQERGGAAPQGYGGLPRLRGFPRQRSPVLSARGNRLPRSIQQGKVVGFLSSKERLGPLESKPPVKGQCAKRLFTDTHEAVVEGRHGETLGWVALGRGVGEQPPGSRC